MKREEESEELPLAGARWRFEAARLPAGGLRLDLAADAAEREALVVALDLLALDRLVLTGQLTGLSRGRFRLTARLEAELAQPCVVTLEPVAARIEESIDIELWPPDGFASPGRQIDIDPDEQAPEPIEDGWIELGRIAYETLAVALPLFPRSAAAGEAAASVIDPAPLGPFAGLARLRKPT